MARVTTIARERPWLVRGAVIASWMGLVATSPAPTYAYHYREVFQGPAFELTSAEPARRFVVRVRAMDLAPNGKPTTSNVIASLSGRIAVSGNEPGSSPFVSTRWFDAASPATVSEVTALTRFDLSQALTFRGDCERPAEATCIAETQIEFSRIDGGASGGTAAVTWSLGFTGSAHKDKEPDLDAAAPWTIEVVEP